MIQMYLSTKEAKLAKYTRLFPYAKISQKAPATAFSFQVKALSTSYKLSGVLAKIRIIQVSTPEG